MPPTDKRAVKSYCAHTQHLANQIGEKDRKLFILKNKDCVGYHLNKRTLSLLDPLFGNQNTWLTVGDYNGLEAQYLQEHGQSAMASDISGIFLQAALNENLIEAYSVENVEYLSFKEDSFEYVFCRHAFHHFPRAFLGLYEMVRVCKKGTILIEPLDILSKMPLLLWLKNITDLIHPHLINTIWKNRFSWETVGNYVFKISEREIEKIAMGINLPCIAFRGINVLLDIKEDLTTVPTDLKLLKKLNRKLKFRDFFCKIRFIPYNALCSMLFKETPNPKELEILRKAGYKIIHLPGNPYL